MAKVLLGSDSRNATTVVPNSFIDEYMADANGEYVKIYLYLLRCMNSTEVSISISKMADKFDHTEKDIKRALKYWEKMHLIRLEFDEENCLSGIYFIDSAMTGASRKRSGTDSVSLHREPTGKEPAVSTVRTSAAEQAVLSAPASTAAASSAKPEYTSDQMKQFRENEAIQELFFVTESYFGHTLNTTEVNTILYWYDSLQFSADLIEYLIEYCTENGHKNIRYMDKVAIAWKEAGYSSVKEAKEANRSHSELYRTIIRSFGISGRNLVDNEMAFIDKWSKKFGFSSELIAEACKRTMQAIHQPSFEYTDSILTNWHKNKIRSMEDIAALDAAFQRSKPQTSSSSRRTTVSVSKNKFNNFPQRTYDYEQLEKQLLKQSLNL